MPFSKLTRTCAVLIAIIFCCASASAMRVTKKLPAHFSAYKSEAIGNTQHCIVGASTDEDGMYEKPVAYVLGANKRKRWVAQLDVPADMYQARATHCARRGNTLFVLVQSDTQSGQSLSQTALYVVQINVATGKVQLQHEVIVPDAYSAWVDKDSLNFLWRANRLVITGNQRPNADRESQTQFSVQLDEALNPVTTP